MGLDPFLNSEVMSEVCQVEISRKFMVLESLTGSCSWFGIIPPNHSANQVQYGAKLALGSLRLLFYHFTNVYTFLLTHKHMHTPKLKRQRAKVGVKLTFF